LSACLLEYLRYRRCAGMCHAAAALLSCDVRG
jgi:hypothetical protein